MRAFIAAVLLAVVASLAAPASAGYSDYYVKQLRNVQYDGSNTPFSITVGGPFSSYTDCSYEASADAREDNFHHIFQCSMGR